MRSSASLYNGYLSGSSPWPVLSQSKGSSSIQTKISNKILNKYGKDTGRRNR